MRGGEFLAGLMFAVLSSIASAADSVSSLTLGVAPSYSEGKYGTASQTDIFYLPVYATYKQDDLSLKLTVPYISVNSAGATISGGVVVGRPGIGRPPSPTAERISESGLGDVWIEGRYRIKGAGAVPDFVPYAKIKLGTASYSKGLGTGENDYEAGLGLEWNVGRNLFPFVDAGYRILGNPPGLALRDIATFDGGAMLRLRQHHFLTAMYMARESAQPGFPAAADLIVAWDYRADSGTGVQVFFDKGLTDGSPDFALGVGVERRF